MGVTTQEEKEKRVLGDRLLPLPLTPREEAWTTEEAWKGSLKGRFSVGFESFPCGISEGCSTWLPCLRSQFGPYPKASRYEPQKAGSLNCGLTNRVTNLPRRSCG